MLTVLILLDPASKFRHVFDKAACGFVSSQIVVSNFGCELVTSYLLICQSVSQVIPQLTRLATLTVKETAPPKKKEVNAESTNLHPATPLPLHWGCGISRCGYRFLIPAISANLFGVEYGLPASLQSPLQTTNLTVALEAKGFTSGDVFTFQ